MPDHHLSNTFYPPSYNLQQPSAPLPPHPNPVHQQPTMQPHQLTGQVQDTLVLNETSYPPLHIHPNQPRPLPSPTDLAPSAVPNQPLSSARPEHPYFETPLASLPTQSLLMHTQSQPGVSTLPQFSVDPSSLPIDTVRSIPANSHRTTQSGTTPSSAKAPKYPHTTSYPSPHDLPNADDIGASSQSYFPAPVFNVPRPQPVMNQFSHSTIHSLPSEQLLHTSHTQAYIPPVPPSNHFLPVTAHAHTQQPAPPLQQPSYITPPPAPVNPHQPTFAHPLHPSNHSLMQSHVSPTDALPPPSPAFAQNVQPLNQSVSAVSAINMQAVVQHTVPPLPVMTVPDMVPPSQYTVPVELLDSFLAVGRACRVIGRYDLAADAFRACISICPESSEARIAYTSACCWNGMDPSRPDFAHAIDLGTVFAEDVFNDIGNSLRALGRASEAEMAYRATLAIAPRHAHAWNNLGNAMRARGAIMDAMSCYSASLTCQPGFAAAHCNLAGLLRDQGKPQEAEARYRAALITDPNLAEAAAGLGTALRDMGRTEEAVTFYVRAVRLQPDAADHHANLANTYKDLNRIEESIVSYQAALALQPDLPDAFCNMVHSLCVICDWRNRSANFSVLLNIVDRQLDALMNHPGTHTSLYRTLVGALSNSTPQLVDVCGGSRSDRDGGSTSTNAAREENSVDVHKRKYTHHPSSPTVVQKSKTRGKIQNCMSSSSTVVAPVLASGLPSVQPFHALIYPMSPEKFKALAAAYAARAESMVTGIPPVAQRWSLPRGPRARLRVGYVSSDYNNHPYSHLTQSIYGLHSQGTTVECYCYALTPSDQSAWRLRIEQESEHFRDISSLTAKQSAEAIAADGIHVLVNCNGYTKGARTELFALRPAPVQVSFMGFPGTLGAHYIEYFITDVVTSPPSLSSRMHSEALLYHPHSYFVNDHKQTSVPGPSAYPQGPLTRAHYGLPEDCFLFIMHNQLYKLSPDTFDVWARILKRVPNSKIWLLRFPPTGEQRIRNEAAARGLAPDRLIFTDVASKDEHVARAGLGDLFLDTPTCNAHTTGTDVLWSGVPMITCPGSLFASRVAASLLTAAGVPELIAHDMNAYEDLAVELATNREKLAAIRSRIESSRYRNALFDTERWVRNVEALYWRAWKNFEAGNEPMHIFGQDVYDGSTMVSRPNGLESMYSGSDSWQSETPLHSRVLMT